MITEWVLTAIYWVADLVQSIIPDVPWPDWLEAPLTWAQSMSDSVSIAGVTAWIHPIVLQVIALALMLRLFSLLLARTRAIVSLITGGGGTK